MSVNKFGASLHGSTADSTGAAGDNDQRMETIRSLNLYVANYVRENALCLGNDRSTFDAMERKMRRVAHPEEDTDAATKRYVDDMERTVGRALDTMEEDMYELTTKRLDASTTAINTAVDKRFRDLKTELNITLQRRFDHLKDRLDELATPTAHV